MTARELMADFDLGPGDPRQSLLYARLLLTYLADHVYTAELANGTPLRDASDFSRWCLELAAEAAKIGKLPQGTEAPQGLRNRHACPECEHEHEGREECGFYLGEGKFCHCPSKVTA